MNYREFKKRVLKYPVITSTVLRMLGEDERILRNQLTRWQKQELIVQLRRGFYLLNPDDRAIQPSRFYLANQLVFPSYVSLESALAHHHIIPETVYQVTCVSTGKPCLINSTEGSFNFRHLKSALYFGFDSVEDEHGLPVFLATPEKALLDFFYLNLASFSLSDNGIFAGSYRFSGQGILQPERLLGLANRFGSGKLLKVANRFIEVELKENRNA